MMSRILLLSLISFGLTSTALADGAVCPPGLTCGYDTCYPCPGYYDEVDASWTNYQCIAARLNKAGYPNIKPSEITANLKDRTSPWHLETLEAVHNCEPGDYTPSQY